MLSGDGFALGAFLGGFFCKMSGPIGFTSRVNFTLVIYKSTVVYSFIACNKERNFIIFVSLLSASLNICAWII